MGWFYRMGCFYGLGYAPQEAPNWALVAGGTLLQLAVELVVDFLCMQV